MAQGSSEVYSCIALALGGAGRWAVVSKITNRGIRCTAALLVACSSISNSNAGPGRCTGSRVNDSRCIRWGGTSLLMILSSSTTLGSAVSAGPVRKNRMSQKAYTAPAIIVTPRYRVSCLVVSGGTRYGV